MITVAPERTTSPKQHIRSAGGNHVVEADGTVRLRITRCSRCESMWFPARDVCGSCGSTDISADLVGPTGTVYAATIVRVDAPGGYRGPYVLAYLDVDGVRTLAHMHADGGAVIAPGLPIRLESRIVADDADTVVYSYVALPIRGDLL